MDGMKAWPRVISGLEYLISHPLIAQTLVQQFESYYSTAEAEVKHWDAILDGVKQAHIFEFSDDTVRLMELTDNEPHNVKLPFPMTFLDAEFEVSVSKVTNHYAGIFLYNFEPNTLIPAPLREIAPHLSAVTFIREMGKPWIIDVFYPISENPVEIYAENKSYAGAKILFGRYARSEWRALRNIALNFLDLLDTPDAYVVPVRRGAKNVARRERQGKPALPPSDIVYLRPSILRYINRLKAAGQWNVSHRFWIRGHFRHYRNERYRDVVAHDRARAEKTGEEPIVGPCSSCFGKEFIKPFVKGKGLLVQKRYREPER